ncbi:MAG TPA: radical SAM protein [Nannocystis exedens]|nr:radical SAM protein [Nannocystis exedens]
MPRRLGVSITWRCNLRCSHCLQSEHSASHDLSLNEFRALLDREAKTGVGVVSLTGGEATLHPQFSEFVREIQTRRLLWTLTTNGLLLDRILRNFCIHPASLVTISLDGPDAASHDEVRAPGTFRRSCRAIRVLALAGMPVQVQATLTRTMIAKLEDMRSCAADLGADRLMLAWPIPTVDLLRQGEFPGHKELLAVRQWVSTTKSDGLLPVALSISHDLVANSWQESTQCSFLTGDEIYVNSKGKQMLCCQVADVSPPTNLVQLGQAATHTPTNLQPYRCLQCMAGQGTLPSGLSDSDWKIPSGPMLEGA